MQLSFRQVDWAYRKPFRISSRTITHSQTVIVELQDERLTGRGEAYGVPYRGETPEAMLDQLERLRPQIERGISRTELEELLPAGGLRNALDCAMWDLEAKRSGRRVWDLLSLAPLRPLITSLTLGLDTPPAMAKLAAAAGQHRLLKLKLGDDDDVERVALVRKARPDARLMVDVNQGWSQQQFLEFVPQLARLGVTLIEQPLPVDQDDVLASFASPIPLCADESCQTIESLATLVGKYACVNIKLDKTGGLTAALRVAHRARQLRLQLLVGCMGGSSLSMAPGFVLGQMCDLVDLDSPLLIQSDVPHGIVYQGECMSAPSAQLWG